MGSLALLGIIQGCPFFPWLSSAAICPRHSFWEAGCEDPPPSPVSCRKWYHAEMFIAIWWGMLVTTNPYSRGCLISSYFFCLYDISMISGVVHDNSIHWFICFWGFFTQSSHHFKSPINLTTHIQQKFGNPSGFGGTLGFVHKEPLKRHKQQLGHKKNVSKGVSNQLWGCLKVNLSYNIMSVV